MTKGRPRKTPDSVISVWSPKEAALYFNRVFPYDFSHSIMRKAGAWESDNLNCIPMIQDRELSILILEDIIPDSENPLFIYKRYSALCLIIRMMLDIQDGALSEEESLDEFGKIVEQACSISEIDPRLLVKAIKNKNDLTDFIAEITGRTVYIMEKCGFSGAPFWISSNFDNLDSNFELNAANNESYIAAISGLDLVDPDKVSWEQVLNFRKDKESRAAIADLRLFFQIS